MRKRVSLRKPFLATVATLLAVIAIAYGSLWMYAVRQSSRPAVELGFNSQHNPQYDQTTHSQSVEDVVPGSPAERAGLRVGDLIIGVNGRALDTDLASNEAYVHGRPGDPVEFTVERAGQPAPLTLHGVFRAATAGESDSIARSSALQITGSFPIPFLLVGFAVLFLRLEEPHAWLLALLFCAFAAAPGFLNPLAVPPALRTFAFAFRAVFYGLLPPLFYLFFAVFPLQSPLDRRLPWLKWVGLLFGACTVFPGLRTGDPGLRAVIGQLVGSRNADLIDAGLNYDLIALGIISLAQNSFMSAVPREARRKSRVILWGTVVGVMPIVLERMAMDFAGYRPSFWVDTVLVLVVSLYPLSFAYAVVKHRVLEIPVLLKRSARFLLVQWGVHILGVIATTAIVLFLARTFSKQISTHPEISVFPVFGLGAFMLWLGIVGGGRVNKRLDRAFFRSAYDVRLILENLAEQTRTASDGRQLAMLLERQVRQALHPKTLACYLESGNGRLAVISGALPTTLETLATNTPVLVELARRGKPWELSPSDSKGAEELKTLAPLAPECLVPILGRENNLIGMLVLGQRLSEEPYSGEDKRLLASVAAQAGIALENIRLAENMAERIEADRRITQEMEIARQVQARLFPQKLPAMKTLEYTGCCIQARTVGGDYYDFLELRPGRLALVLADIAGKGVSGALLMANLQANLRSQYAIAIDDLPRLLTSVNRLFYESTNDASYATLFFADYDESTRKLRYANCGHLPPALLRAGSQDQASKPSKVEWLDSTCTVMGLFETWQCEIAEVQLAPGDTLVLYTDGVTEAANTEGEEFGETHLLETLKSHASVPVGPLLQAVVTAVQQFSGGSEQQDDITLVIARCLA
jgi:sigma-B regulation protein RsbU (phosphoserine phosphatase)